MCGLCAVTFSTDCRKSSHESESAPCGRNVIVHALDDETWLGLTQSSGFISLTATQKIILKVC